VLDEESYSISFKYAGKQAKVHMAIDLFKDTENKNATVINFRKESGCIFKYQKGLKDFQDKYIDPIYEHYSRKMETSN
jgi:hypothetical protein